MGHYDQDYEYAEQEQSRVRKVRNEAALAKIKGSILNTRKELSSLDFPNEVELQQAYLKLREFEFWVKEAGR